MTRCTASISAIICPRTHPAGCREPDPAVARGAVFIPALSCWRMCRRGITSQKMSSPSRHRERIGSELELFAEAVNWRTYWQRQTVPLLGRRVLEVGAGFGTVTGDLCRSPVEHWLALKPDRATAAHLAADRQTGLLPAMREPRHRSTETFGPEERFDTALYIDVLEH